MELTIFLAKVIGWYFVIMGLFFLTSALFKSGTEETPCWIRPL